MSGKTQDAANHSEIAGAPREMMKGFEAAGVIDGRTTHDFDEACLAPAEVLSSEAVGAICEREQVFTCPASVAVPASHR